MLDVSPKRERRWTKPADSLTSGATPKSCSKAFVDMIKQRMADLFPGEAQFVTANRFGINPSYLSNILNLRVPPPSLEKVLSIAEALQIDPIELAILAGYVSGPHPTLSARRKSEGREISRALASILASEVSVSLDDMMAMLLGKYVEIRETSGIEALIGFIESELLPGLSSRKHWAGREGNVLRTYRGIGEGILAVISAMEKANRHLEHLPRARSGDSRNPDYFQIEQGESKQTGEITELGNKPNKTGQIHESSTHSVEKKARRPRRSE